MTNKEKLKKEYDKIVGEQINTGNDAGDMYPIMEDVLLAGLRYIPAKVLKRIIERNKDENKL